MHSSELLDSYDSELLTESSHLPSSSEEKILSSKTMSQNGILGLSCDHLLLASPAFIEMCSCPFGVSISSRFIFDCFNLCTGREYLGRQVSGGTDIFDVET